MCGIVGVLGTTSAAPMLLEALKRLEYRGYDSAGIATLEYGEHIARRRAQGKIKNLEDKLAHHSLFGRSGIGHTRWATHGEPSEANAHPHADSRLALVHNGIIENFQEIKIELLAEGCTFASDTDTEVIVHLISRSLQLGSTPLRATKEALERLRGTFAIVVLFEGEDDLLIGARQGSPLAIGYGEGEMFFGSDAIALAPFTNKITYLEDGDIAVLHRGEALIFDRSLSSVTEARSVTNVVVSKLLVDKGDYRHFMLKEIHEQPEVVAHALDRYLDIGRGALIPLTDCPVDLSKIRSISIAACGTAYYAALVGKYWIESLAHIPVAVEIASEFRYRQQPFAADGITIVVSQSGQTADTLAALRYARTAGQKVFAVLNTVESSIGRECDYVLPINAGIEVSVASTKVFTCMLAVFVTLALSLAKVRGMLTQDAERRYVRTLAQVPALMSETLRLAPRIEGLAELLRHAEHALYLGRGMHYPLALEGALKLKEISYIHAEGYAAGELKHGPIALIDQHMPVVVIAPHDQLYDKMASNVEEVAARGGRFILLSDARWNGAPQKLLGEITLPVTEPFIAPFVYAVPLQLLAYYTAVARGTDVDQPRNLAKSVTVE